MMFCDPHSFGVALMQVAFASGLFGSLIAVALIYVYGNIRDYLRHRRFVRRFGKRKGLV